MVQYSAVQCSAVQYSTVHGPPALRGPSTTAHAPSTPEAAAGQWDEGRRHIPATRASGMRGGGIYPPPAPVA
eukprot:1195115-Prorocentrum_minimum.AAC.3